MTLETGVKELAEAVGADVKALADGKVNSNDPRLSDAREWSEATVTQAEAEAGTASTRRAWTAQRVRQAVVAAWGALSSAWGRGFVNSADASAARQNLGLGTAATRDVTILQTDTTANRLLKVADFGIGGFNPLHNNRNADDLTGGQRYSWGEPFTEQDAVALNLPALGGDPNSARSWHAETMGRFNRIVMFATEVFGIGTTKGRTFVRVKFGTIWYPWSEITQVSNLQQATGQSTLYPMTQKAVTDAINARDFADASGVLTVTSGALSNDMSNFLSSLTFAEMRSKLDVISKQSVQALDPDTATLPDLIRALQAP